MSQPLSIQLLAPCPACSATPGLADNPANQQGPGDTGYHKRGRYKGYPRSTMPVCRLCCGKKFVNLNHICECGMPALFYEGKLKVWYCGYESCAKAAVWRLNRSSAQWSGI